MTRGGHARVRRARLAAAILLVATACGGTPGTSSPGAVTPTKGAATQTSAPTATPGGSLVLMTYDAFALSDSVIAAFQQQTGLNLQILRAGDAGSLVNQAILSKDHPLGDVLFGVDNTFLSRALDAGIFEPYTSPALDSVPAPFQLDPQHRVTPTDYGDVCLNLDKSAFASGTPPAPQRLEDLTDPRYRGDLVVENPATSSPGLAFVLATIARFGETGSYTWLDYWADLRANDVLVSPSWDDAYETQFSGSSGHGPRPIVVSYASSPPAEVYYAATPIAEPPTAVVLDGCFRQVEFVGVLSGAADPVGARAWVDFMLSSAVQQDIPLQDFVFPAVAGTPLPDVFRQFAQVPPSPLSVDPVSIEANRERWIDEWTQTVLR
jgi:thiamine transport system substrate-binding protein